MRYLLITTGHDGTRVKEIETPYVPDNHQMRPGETAYVVEFLDSKRERAL